MENRVWERKNRKSRLFSLEVHQGTRDGLFPASLCPSFLFLQSASEVFIAPYAGPSLASTARAAAGPGEGALTGVRALALCPEAGRGWGMPVPAPPPPQVSCGAAAAVPRPRAQRQPRREPRGSLCHSPATARLPLSPPGRGSPDFLLLRSFLVLLSGLWDLGGLGSRFWISPLALPRAGAPTPAAPAIENPGHLPPDTRLDSGDGSQR